MKAKNDFNDEKSMIYQWCRCQWLHIREGTEDWTITDSQRTELLNLLGFLRSKYPGLFVAFPGDEEKYGGCMSAGRGFVHVSPGGNLEPCPFAPYSDTSLGNSSLKQALRSDFLETIRQNHEELIETSGGCALWEKGIGCSLFCINVPNSTGIFNRLQITLTLPVSSYLYIPFLKDEGKFRFLGVSNFNVELLGKIMNMGEEYATG